MNAPYFLQSLIPKLSVPKGPWLNSNVGQSLQNLKDGKYQEGADQNESDAHTKIIPLVAMYAGQPVLKKFVEQAVRTTLNNDRAVCLIISFNFFLACSTPVSLTQ